jgi:hypothetical protein
MKKIIAFLLTIMMVSGSCSFTVFAESVSGFPLYQNETAAPIFVANEDHAQVMRAAGDLGNDIRMVTGTVPALSIAAPAGELAIIIGSVDESPLIAQIAAAGKLPEAETLAGKWEAYVVKTIDEPLPGVEKALVIAGSDKRGTIYGIYEVSEMIGVSPYYWFSDVTPQIQEEIVLPEGIVAQADEPTVKYRGIFINDERNLWYWSDAFAGQEDLLGNTGAGNPNSAMYEKVFEMLLRVGANTLWPAMHGYSTAFNYDKDENGIPINAQVADAYGIVMGSSHCEPMLRNSNGDGSQNEWDRWIAEYNREHGTRETRYDFSVNKEAITQYWREGVREKKDFEAVWTIGMRGRHDGEMGYAGTNGSLLRGLPFCKTLLTRKE